MLYLISTPIGNLEDISFRAIRILKKVDLIAAEDTRRTRRLLNHYKIQNKLISYHDQNKKSKTYKLITLLKQGKHIALVSDAGTPGISDPGFYLVRECIKNNIKIIPVPGASSILAALTCSGLPTDKFSFYGFLPKTRGKKEKALVEISDHTAIFFESPYRISKTLELMTELIPDYNIVIARELTKKFEEFVRGKPKEVLEHFQNKPVKGEFVLLISK